MTEYNDNTKKILAELAKLGGGRLNAEDDVQRTKNGSFAIPQTLTLMEAARYLADLSKSQGEVKYYRETFPYRPMDGATCAIRALKRVFGSIDQRASFFGPMPEMRTVKTGAHTNEQVPWGEFALPMLPNSTITFYEVEDEDAGLIFGVMIAAPKSLAGEVAGVFTLIHEELATASIYRGKAITGSERPEFIDLSTFDPEKVVYAQGVERQLKANVWSIIENTDTHKRLGQKLKRQVCVYGQYGTGKTLFMQTTALKCEQNGWTCIVAKPDEDLAATMQMARLYQPAVVVFEDLDIIAGTNKSDVEVSKLLDAFDGLTSKDSQVITVLTTNHVTDLHKGMLRPGRLDALIEIGNLDRAGIRRLIEVVIPADVLHPEIEWEMVADANADYIPAFVVEGANRAVKYAISANPSAKAVVLDTEALVYSAQELRSQYTAYREANDHKGHVEPIDAVFKDIAREASVEAIRTEMNVRVLNAPR